MPPRGDTFGNQSVATCSPCPFTFSRPIRRRSLESNRDNHPTHFSNWSLEKVSLSCSLLNNLRPLRCGILVHINPDNDGPSSKFWHKIPLFLGTLMVKAAKLMSSGTNEIKLWKNHQLNKPRFDGEVNFLYPKLGIWAFSALRVTESVLK